MACRSRSGSGGRDWRNGRARFRLPADPLRTPEVQGASARPMPWPWRTLCALADAMPLLDAENLHDFRKATKKARYVAESGARERNSSSVAKALKRIQDAIGDWHDWLCLAEEAKTALGQDGAGADGCFRARGRAPFCRRRWRRPEASADGSWESGWRLAEPSAAAAAKRPPGQRS